MISRVTVSAARRHPFVEGRMLLVAPDPRHGISPVRIGRVRSLLDGLPAPGIAIALPGGPDGVLDALVLRPDGVLGLVPAAERVPVPSAPVPGAPVSCAPSSTAAGATGVGSSQDRAAAEIDRLLALADPTPTAPRQVVPVVGGPSHGHQDDPERTDEDQGVGVATAARLVLTSSAGPIVLDAAEVRRLLGAWRLAEFVPSDAELHSAGFPAGAPVPAARTSERSDPGGPLARPATAALPVAAEESPRLGLPDGGSGPRRRRDRRVRREVALPAWVSTWRGLTVAAALTFVVALGVAVLVVRGTSSTPEEVAAEPVRVVDGVSWTQRVVTTEPTCEGHAYGLAVQFLRERPCVQLDRTLWTADADGTPVVAAVAVVHMGDAASAAALKSLIDSSGTGNVADLLREGAGYPGAPGGLTDAGYSATQLGETVVIAETDATGSSSESESTLDGLARSVLVLRP